MFQLDHKVAIGLKVILGSIVGLLIGYVIFAISFGADGAPSFRYWLNNPLKRGVLWWFVGGGVFTFVRYICNRSLERQAPLND